MTASELEIFRVRWLRAARTYYLHPEEDSGVSDAEWDHLGRVLFEDRQKVAHCPILNHPDYAGGSLFWVSETLYADALTRHA